MSTPRIVVMGQEVSYGEFPRGDALNMEDHFKPVRLSPRAINPASKIIPGEHRASDGLHTWLSKRAEFVFSKL